MDDDDITTGSVTGMNEDNENNLIVVFRGNRPALGYNYIDPWSTMTTGNPSSQNVNAASFGTDGHASIVMGFMYSADDSTPNFSTQTPTFDSQVDGSYVMCAYTIYDENIGANNHTIDASDTGYYTFLGSCMFQLS